MSGARTMPSMLSSSRCPFCHEGVTPTKSVACQSCLARHHSACWGESAACASCGSSGALRPELRSIDEPLLRELLADVGYDASAIGAYFARGGAPDQARCEIRERGALCNLVAEHQVGQTWLCALHASHEYRGMAWLSGVFAALLAVGAGLLVTLTEHMTGDMQAMAWILGGLALVMLGWCGWAGGTASRLVRAHESSSR